MQFLHVHGWDIRDIQLTAAHVALFKITMLFLRSTYLSLWYRWCPYISLWDSDSSWWGRSSQRTIPSGGTGRGFLHQCPGEAPDSCWGLSWSCSWCHPGEPGRSPPYFVWPWASGSRCTGRCRTPLLRPCPTPRQRGRLAAGSAGERSAPCDWWSRCIFSESRAGCSCWIWPLQTACFQLDVVDSSCAVVVDRRKQCAAQSHDCNCWWIYTDEPHVGWSLSLHNCIIRLMQVHFSVLCGVKPLSLFALHNLIQMYDQCPLK